MASRKRKAKNTRRKVTGRAAATAIAAMQPSARVQQLARSFETARAAAYNRAGGRAAVRRTVKVVAEGDSWFSYFPAYDVLACLRKQSWNGYAYNVADRARAGALLNDMVYGRDMLDTYELLEERRPDVFLFSGGGNDIAGSELFVMLYHREAVELGHGLPEINKSILRGLVAEVFHRAYSDLIELVRIKMAQIGKPNMPIVLHGYDYAIPDGRGWAGAPGPLPGPWLDPSLTRKGYEKVPHAQLRRAIVRELIDAFNAMLADIAGRYPNTHYVNLRGTLPDEQWGNELHPTRAGFMAVTRKIEATVRRVVTGQ